MLPCAYCERPLVCDACQSAYSPPTPEAYEALSLSGTEIICPTCEKVLVCHWCKAPYDGSPEADESGAEPSGV